jgi:hypothetical protein
MGAMDANDAHRDEQQCSIREVLARRSELLDQRQSQDAVGLP